MITIFTPTYNRAYRLPTLYQSLRRQSCKDFEWVIVDDGSQDNTRELVESWVKEDNPFEICYYLKENGGKHTAINVGVEHARSDWFLIVDSDDYLTDDAVEKVEEWTKTVDEQDIAAVSGTRCYPDRRIIGECGIDKGSYIDVKNNQRRKYRLLGDKAEVYRTEILKKYPFPVFHGERFLSEAAVWDRIALDGYKVRWFSQSIIVCEYLPDGLSAQLRDTDIEVINFEGCTYCAQVAVKAYSGIEKCRFICQYINKGRKKGLSYAEIAKRIDVDLKLISLLSILVYAKNTVRLVSRAISKGFKG